MKIEFVSRLEAHELKRRRRKLLIPSILIVLILIGLLVWAIRSGAAEEELNDEIEQKLSDSLAIPGLYSVAVYSHSRNVVLQISTSFSELPEAVQLVVLEEARQQYIELLRKQGVRQGLREKVTVRVDDSVVLQGDALFDQNRKQLLSLDQVNKSDDAITKVLEEWRYVPPQSVNKSNKYYYDTSCSSEARNPSAAYSMCVQRAIKTACGHLMNKGYNPLDKGPSKLDECIIENILPTNLPKHLKSGSN